MDSNTAMVLVLGTVATAFVIVFAVGARAYVEVTRIRHRGERVEERRRP